MSGPWIAAFVALWVTTLLVALVLLGVLRRVTAVLERVEASVSASDLAFGAPVGSTFHPFDLFDDRGERFRWMDVVRRPSIVLFMSTDCIGCRQLTEHLVGVGHEVDNVPLVVVMDDTPEARREPLPTGLNVLYQRERAATRALDNRATPQAYVLDPSGIVLSRRIPGGLSDLRDMAWFQQKGGDRGAGAVGTAHSYSHRSNS